MKRLLLILLLCSVTKVQSNAKSDTLEIFNVESSINGSTYQLYVRTPTGYSTQKKYPVIFLLEANYYHRTFVNLYDSIYRTDYDDHIIVGIGYLPSPFHDNAFIRDFTPHPIDNFPNSGKAEEFKQILETELIPTLLNNYEADESRLSIVGHHYSALFLVWTLTQEAPKFANYVICSPVLNFCNNLTDLKIDDKSETGIYLSSGTSKIKFVKNLHVNKSKFTSLENEFKKYASNLNPLKTTNFETTLRYDDLFRGFSEGISFIIRNNQNRGNWKNQSVSNSSDIKNRSTVVIDRLTDPNTSNQYEVSIYIPKNTTPGELPLVVILDGDFNFTELLYVAQKSMTDGEIPQSVIVGVGYGTTIIGRGNNRDRDFLPNKLKKIESGNAENFSNLIDTQLIAHLSRYSLDKQNMTIAGHSFGGLFLTYLLTKDTTISFINLIISSPAIWRDKTVIKKLRRSGKRIDSNIFIASGKLDDNDKDTMKLTRALKNKSNNKLKTVFYPNDNHLTVISKAFIDGLKFFNK